MQSQPSRDPDSKDTSRRARNVPVGNSIRLGKSIRRIVEADKQALINVFTNPSIMALHGLREDQARTLLTYEDAKTKPGWAVLDSQNKVEGVIFFEPIEPDSFLHDYLTSRGMRERIRNGRILRGYFLPNRDKEDDLLFQWRTKATTWILEPFAKNNGLEFFLSIPKYADELDGKGIFRACWFTGPVDRLVSTVDPDRVSLNTDRSTIVGTDYSKILLGQNRSSNPSLAEEFTPRAAIRESSRSFHFHSLLVDRAERLRTIFGKLQSGTMISNPPGTILTEADSSAVTSLNEGLKQKWKGTSQKSLHPESIELISKDEWLQELLQGPAKGLASLTPTEQVLFQILWLDLKTPPKRLDSILAQIDPEEDFKAGLRLNEKIASDLIRLNKHKKLNFYKNMQDIHQITLAGWDSMNAPERSNVLEKLGSDLRNQNMSEEYIARVSKFLTEKPTIHLPMSSSDGKTSPEDYPTFPDEEIDSGDGFYGASGRNEDPEPVNTQGTQKQKAATPNEPEQTEYKILTDSIKKAVNTESPADMTSALKLLRQGAGTFNVAQLSGCAMHLSKTSRKVLQLNPEKLRLANAAIESRLNHFFRLEGAGDEKGLRDFSQLPSTDGVIHLLSYFSKAEGLSDSLYETLHALFIDRLSELKLENSMTAVNAFSDLRRDPGEAFKAKFYSLLDEALKVEDHFVKLRDLSHGLAAIAKLRWSKDEDADMAVKLMENALNSLGLGQARSIQQIPYFVWSVVHIDLAFMWDYWSKKTTPPKDRQLLQNTVRDSLETVRDILRMYWNVNTPFNQTDYHQLHIAGQWAKITGLGKSLFYLSKPKTDKKGPQGNDKKLESKTTDKPEPKVEDQLQDRINQTLDDLGRKAKPSPSAQAIVSKGPQFKPKRSNLEQNMERALEGFCNNLESNVFLRSTGSEVDFKVSSDSGYTLWHADGQPFHTVQQVDGSTIPTIQDLMRDIIALNNSENPCDSVVRVGSKSFGGLLTPNERQTFLKRRRDQAKLESAIKKWRPSLRITTGRASPVQVGLAQALPVLPFKPVIKLSEIMAQEAAAAEQAKAAAEQAKAAAEQAKAVAEQAKAVAEQAKAAAAAALKPKSAALTHQKARATAPTVVATEAEASAGERADSKGGQPSPAQRGGNSGARGRGRHSQQAPKKEQTPAQTQHDHHPAMEEVNANDIQGQILSLSLGLEQLQAQARQVNYREQLQAQAVQARYQEQRRAQAARTRYLDQGRGQAEPAWYQQQRRAQAEQAQYQQQRRAQAEQAQYQQWLFEQQMALQQMQATGVGYYDSTGLFIPGNNIPAGYPIQTQQNEDPYSTLNPRASAPARHPTVAGQASVAGHSAAAGQSTIAGQPTTQTTNLSLPSNFGGVTYPPYGQ